MATINRIGVIGCGQMGGGIAQVAAQSGYQVTMFDVSGSQLEKAMTGMEKSLTKLSEKGKLKGTVAEVIKRVRPVSQIEELGNCDFVIEAASENRELKLKLFGDLDRIVPKGAILCTNTSSISITEIARQTSRAEKVAGMHFMNPVPLMSLVEGIRGLATSNETFKIVREVAESMGKVFIEAKDAPGFVVNRVLLPFINEAFFALQEGLASPKDIDQAIRLGLNHPMGPFELADYVGLDVCLSVMEILHRDLGDSKYRPAPLLRKYVEAGWFGKKTGRGVYVY
ncbi:MAG: 3-hydroxybutyryl-CoA dehydrogenase [Deltaproteobacteria bacterium]|nr:3-hydroxybutyryl-CoA dehydrogenase [Deltaproteobacteria bacterium]